MYKIDTKIYALINKYKINNLIHKKNVKNIATKPQLVLVNKLFIYYNFSYSYKFCYLL